MPNPDPDTTAPDDGYELIGYLDPPAETVAAVRRFQPAQVDAFLVPAADNTTAWGEIAAWLQMHDIDFAVATDDEFPTQVSGITVRNRDDSYLEAEIGQVLIHDITGQFGVMSADRFEQLFFDTPVDHIVLGQDAAGEWRWSARGGNNRNVGTSGEGFETQTWAHHVATHMFPGAPIEIRHAGES